MTEDAKRWCLCGHHLTSHHRLANVPGLLERCTWCRCAAFEPSDPQERAALHLHRAITHSVAVALERATEEDDDADTP